MFDEVGDGVEVEIVEQASALSAYPRQPTVMIQCHPERAHFFPILAAPTERGCVPRRGPPNHFP
ncbi:hypothetical protein SCE1572_14020 [Sorangium cellulosum So0157-2]|uniref:Uncharacterized protein n=1 Tax=Sorangium cellulosum So0157-2 TaxID=1254432 RepID=S4XY71_SORCE|nr:hypothetical protein SCE1572_14020 [Sorangium cellulosum So0157-2]